jgi:site-specific recombinase XerD
MPERKDSKENTIRCSTKNEMKIPLSLPGTGSPLGPRGLTLMPTLCPTGARGSETCGLSAGGISFAAPPGKTRARLAGKGGKSHAASIASHAPKLVFRCLEARGIALDGRGGGKKVFAARIHDGMSAARIGGIAGKHAAQAKKRGPGLFMESCRSTHCLRRSIAAHIDSLAAIKARDMQASQASLCTLGSRQSWQANA